MIAQVFTVGAPAEITPEDSKYVQDLMEEARSREGCEGIYTLAADDGHGLAIVLWRDRAALEAVSEQQQRDNQDLMAHGVPDPGPGTVYEVVAAL